MWNLKPWNSAEVGGLSPPVFRTHDFNPRFACSHVFELRLGWYLCTLVPMADQSRVIERVQTGVRMEKRLLKVLKALAAYHDMTLGDLLEGIVLHAFDGARTHSRPETILRPRS
jgi:hypothetical protein